MNETIFYISVPVSEILIRSVLVPLDRPDPDRINYSFVNDPVFMSNREIPIHFTIKLANLPFKSAKFCLWLCGRIYRV